MKLGYNPPEMVHLMPKPLHVDGVDVPVLSLNGAWRFRAGDDLDVLARDSAFDTWEAIDIPSFQMERRFVCKRAVELPPDWAGMRLYLRFETINGFADVYIDGERVLRHLNGFSAFGVDITAQVAGRRRFVLAVAVEEAADKVSTFSVGGILRGVALYALPPAHLRALYVTTTFDHQFRHADMQLAWATDGAPERVTATLTDPVGLPVWTGPLSGAPDADGLHRDRIPVQNPLKWDAEHPWLYTLSLRVEAEGKGEAVTQRIGLRQIDRAGNRLYVNGQEVKLRGVCRHETTPLHGRCMTPELIEQDVALYKEANCNYIRTSHYPPSEYFLDLCDEKGLYVEDELPLAFIARTLDYTQRDPAHTARYLTAFDELYARDANHPSVLIWSLCNESFGGYNFNLLNRHAQRVDPTRPTKFSYPMTMREEDDPIDIWSVHYANLDSDLAAKADNVSVAGAPGRDMPVLHDEFAHVPCYNRTEHRRDPHVRAFWGEGLALFWHRIWHTEGALGGAIWAGIDETDSFRGGNTRLEWGIIDVWRRRKPEHYMTRKAYTPVLAALLPMEADGLPRVLLENRFCHTDLHETRIEWACGDQSGTLRGPCAPPRAKAALTLPVRAQPGQALSLRIHDAAGDCVDAYAFVPMPQATQPVPPSRAPLALTQTDADIRVTGDGFALVISRASGQITSGTVDGEPVLTGGPTLHMPYFRLGTWQADAVQARLDGDAVVVDIHGAYQGAAVVAFALRILPGGVIETRYTIERLLRPLPHMEKLRVGVDCGGLDELGVSFLTTPGMTCLSWRRDGLYSLYPDDHIARNAGVAHRFSKGSRFGEAPEIGWGEEMRSYILNGRYDVDYRGTNDFRSLKANVREACVYGNGTGAARVLSDAAHAVRLEVEEPEALLMHAADPRLRYSGAWFPVEEVRGSRGGTEMWSKSPGAAVEVPFDGTGIVWYGPVDTVCGIARVYVDGKLMDGGISQRVAGCDFPGSAPGYDRKYDYPLYSVEGLADGPHTLRVEATGEKTPDAGDAYIIIDHFRVLRIRGEESVRCIVLNDFNYPHIAWGNYCKPPILAGDGFTQSVTIRLTTREAAADEQH